MLRRTSTIPMLRSSAALVFLALTALLAPSAVAHTRTRTGATSAARAHGLRRDSSEVARGSSAARGRSARKARTSDLKPARGRSRSSTAEARSDRHLSPREQKRQQAALNLHGNDRRRARHAQPDPPQPVRGRRARGRRDAQEIATTTHQSAQPRSLTQTGRSATPADFLDAATIQHRPQLSQPTAPLPQRPASVAQPVPVVSVIRPNTDHPQLESIADAATEPLVLPQLPNDRGRRGIPAPLYGTHEILVHQNQMADRDGLDRILNDDDLLDKRRDRQLVPIPESIALHVDDRLPDNRRFCRPWVAQFLATMAAAHYARFHTPLQVNSAVRTVEFQHHLIRINGNAAPAEGDTASPHLTGQAIDIAKRWMPLAEIAWMRGYLLPLIEGRRIDVEEEFQQSCFHISAYRSAAPPVPAIGSPGRYVAEAPGSTANSLAWSTATR